MIKNVTNQEDEEKSLSRELNRQYRSKYKRRIPYLISILICVLIILIIILLGLFIKNSNLVKQLKEKSKNETTIGQVTPIVSYSFNLVSLI